MDMLNWANCGLLRLDNLCAILYLGDYYSTCQAINTPVIPRNLPLYGVYGHRHLCGDGCLRRNLDPSSWHSFWVMPTDCSQLGSYHCWKLLFQGSHRVCHRHVIESCDGYCGRFDTGTGGLEAQACVDSKENRYQLHIWTWNSVSKLVQRQ
jgi:hypothetical protein